ncbi:MAG: hypothetical protein WCQ99_13280 [Pseudomonadota bacterium]
MKGGTTVKPVLGIRSECNVAVTIREDPHSGYDVLPVNYWVEYPLQF